MQTVLLIAWFMGMVFLMKVTLDLLDHMKARVAEIKKRQAENSDKE